MGRYVCKDTKVSILMLFLRSSTFHGNFHDIVILVTFHGNFQLLRKELPIVLLSWQVLKLYRSTKLSAGVKDSQVRVRFGSPITGYVQESRSRAARQRILNRVWKDNEGVEHFEANNLICGCGKMDGSGNMSYGALLGTG